VFVVCGLLCSKSQQQSGSTLELMIPKMSFKQEGRVYYVLPGTAGTHFEKTVLKSRRASHHQEGILHFHN
jgi:hypothetical protein